MPTYEYHCESCDKTFEVTQKMTANPLRKCILCKGKPVKKLISAGAGFILAGGGWFKDGYGDKTPEKPVTPPVKPVEAPKPADPAKAKDMRTYTKPGGKQS